MTTQHTPTPWKVARQEKFGPTHIVGANGQVIAEILPNFENLNIPDRIEQVKANAAFIVRACNAHEGLVKALKASDSRRRMLEGGMKPFNGTSAAMAFVTELNSIVDAAIAKAEGK